MARALKYKYLYTESGTKQDSIASVVSLRARAHTEKLAHEVFYVITAMTIGVWTITIQYLTEVKYLQSLMYILTLFLAICGFFLIRKFQHSNDEIRIIMNKIRLKTGIQNIKVEINGKEENIFPKEWEKYVFKDVLFCRKGLKSTGRFSWWASYKTVLLFLSIASIVLLVRTALACP